MAVFILMPAIFSDATVYDKNGADKLNADAKTDGEDDGIKDGSDEDSVKDASDKIDASSAKDIEDDDITELEDYEINALLKMITRIQENRKNEEKTLRQKVQSLPEQECRQRHLMFQMP